MLLLLAVEETESEAERLDEVEMLLGTPDRLDFAVDTAGDEGRLVAEEEAVERKGNMMQVARVT